MNRPSGMPPGRPKPWLKPAFASNKNTVLSAPRPCQHTARGCGLTWLQLRCSKAGAIMRCLQMISQAMYWMETAYTMHWLCTAKQADRTTMTAGTLLLLRLRCDANMLSCCSKSLQGCISAQ